MCFGFVPRVRAFAFLVNIDKQTKDAEKHQCKLRGSELASEAA